MAAGGVNAFEALLALSTSPVSVDDANARATLQGRFTFKSNLGSGAFGTVLKAYDKTKKCHVAVKLIESRGAVSPWELLLSLTGSGERKRLEDAKNEAKTLYELRHPNIVGYITSYEYAAPLNRKGFAIVTRFCEKGNLCSYLKRYRPLQEKRLQWFQQLASALQFIHSKNITHRDLKPANILIDGDDTLKICDVGLAKAVWDIQEVYLKYSGGMSLGDYMTTQAGTVPYMAPEVFNRHYNLQSDIFSLGLVFVMIAESPTPLIPMAKWASIDDYVGKLLHDQKPPRSLPASYILFPHLQHSTPHEVRLFDKMLKFEYHDRPKADEVVKEVLEIARLSHIGIRLSSSNPDPKPEPISGCCCT